MRQNEGVKNHLDDETVTSSADIFAVAKDIILAATSIILALVALMQARIISEQNQTAKQALYAQNVIGIGTYLLRQMTHNQLWVVFTNSGPGAALNVTFNVMSQNGKTEKSFVVGPLGVGEEKRFYIGQFQSVHLTTETDWTAYNSLGQDFKGHLWLPTAEAKTTTEPIS